MLFFFLFYTTDLFSQNRSKKQKQSYSKSISKRKGRQKPTPKRIRRFDHCLVEQIADADSKRVSAVETAV